ncbi:flagellin modification protein FlmF [Phenylobacterium sp.]|uniref:flagellin modification protein FlmF n=1 Tax=Phenylobacterium sp. TaxID=1871053 RepID=UPI002E35C4AC|nr:flagellin modification protein FlmF [Phenylobacterium sp.]HEX2561732.1 flagellin modification protein FlmF [Phenylobacterium sp.]
MKKVRIVGGGLTGVLAAFQAHGLGCRDIELHERFDALGGVALPQSRGGLELREGCIYFGPAGDPIRTLLEGHGVGFEDIDNRFGSVSLGAGGDLTATRDFGGPAYPCADLALTPPAGDSLANRIACYPAPIAEAVASYCRWHLGDAPLEEVHESAAIPLAVNRVFPALGDLPQLAQLKTESPLHDELFAIPRHLWGRTNNATAALPTDGFPAMFRQCRQALERLGVRVHDTSLVSPRQALAARKDDEVLVWAANPTPLFKPLGLRPPKLVRKTFATYVFRCRYEGPLPFYVQNFTAEGAVFRIYVYESGGQALATAECVEEADDAPLRREIDRWMSPFEEVRMSLGEQVFANLQPRWIYHSTDAMAQLEALRDVAAKTLGPSFVPGAWEPYSKAEKFHQVQAALEAALGAGRRAATAA